MLPRNQAYQISTECPKCGITIKTEVTYLTKFGCELLLKIIVCLLLWGVITGGIFAGLFYFLEWFTHWTGYILAKITIIFFGVVAAVGLALAGCCSHCLDAKECWALHACPECGLIIGKSRLRNFILPPGSVKQCEKDEDGQV